MKKIKIGWSWDYVKMIYRLTFHALRARNVARNNSFSPPFDFQNHFLKTDAFALQIFRGSWKSSARFGGNPRIDVTKFPSRVWILIFNMDERSQCAKARKYPSSIDNRLDVSLASNETVLDSSRLAPSWNSSFSLPRSDLSACRSFSFQFPQRTR